MIYIFIVFLSQQIFHMFFFFLCPYFWRVCSFPQLPTAHLAVSSSCVSLGSLPTQEFSFGCNLIKPTWALCVKLLTLNTPSVFFLENSPSGYSYNVFRKVLHQRRNQIIFSNELFLELNGWRLFKERRTRYKIPEWIVGFLLYMKVVEVLNYVAERGQQGISQWNVLPRALQLFGQLKFTSQHLYVPVRGM